MILNHKGSQKEIKTTSPKTSAGEILAAETLKINNIFKSKEDEFMSVEFSTPNCSRVEDYSFGALIGRGAYAEVKECVHIKTGERVAIKQYDRYKLLDLQRKK
jgi:hypothetical protein